MKPGDAVLWRRIPVAESSEPTLVPAVIRSLSGGVATIDAELTHGGIMVLDVDIESLREYQDGPERI